MVEKGESVELPPVDEAAMYLVGYLWDIGASMPVGMGTAPIDSQRLVLWQQETGIELQPWEAQGLRRLSRAYVAESAAAEEFECPPPWSAVPTPELREQLARDLGAALRSRMSRNKKHRN